MICHPEKQDIEQMKAIWELCFGDDRETVDVFYDRCFSSGECYISKSGNTVHAVLQMIKCSLIYGNKTLEARYMYAVCTHPDYQGRGIMTSLITEAIENEKKNGTKAVICIPAENGLFGFYKRFGFTDVIYCANAEYGRDYISRNSVECNYEINADCSLFNEKRNEILNRFSSVAYVSFADKYISLANGFSYSSIITDNSYALFTQGDDCVKVVDSCFDEKGFKELCFALKNETHANEYSFVYNGKYNNSLKGVVYFTDDNISLNKKTYFGIELE